jgi:cell division transport system permease protein
MIDLTRSESAPLGGPRVSTVPVPRYETPLVPRNSIAGRSLIAVLAIMTFLASLTSGGVILVTQAANEWQSDVSHEVTIQIVPASGRDAEADVARATSVARDLAGIAEVRPYSREESAKLLEPWLGTGLSLTDLPVPRLIVVKIARGATPDLPQLRKMLAEQVPGAMLDDHRGWIDRMRVMSGTAVGIGISLVLLMVAATVLSVTFATRGAMAANRNVIEVLHFVGAKNGYIASNFQRHFLLLGFEGGGIGGGAAIALFALAALLNRWLSGTSAGEESFALFGSFSLGLAGYVAVLFQIVLIAGVTAWTSRQTVNRTLETID